MLRYAVSRFASARTVKLPAAASYATVPAGENLIDLLGSLKIKTSRGEMAPVDLFKGKKVAIVGVVGAYTGVCMKQVPGYVDHLAEFRGKGVDDIAVVSVNDPAVMTAWQVNVDPDAQLTYVADWDAAFTKAVGADVDLSAAAFGVRSTRYAMLVDDGVVVSVHREASPGELKLSDAASMLSHL